MEGRVGSEILEKLNTVFREVFEDEFLKVTETTTSEQVVNWDSLVHVYLILQVEEAFSIKFALGEMQCLKDVGVLVRLIESKISQ
jgi:acyl carrier protein